MKKILLVSLALVLALFVANGIAKNNVKGLVEVPELTSAEVVANWDDCDEDYYVACWDIDETVEAPVFRADKWSVVIFMNMYYEWAEACIALKCPTCPDILEIELDYSTKDGVDADNCDPIVFWQADTYKYCLAIEADLVAEDLEAYLEEAMAECEDCASDCPAPTINSDFSSMKVKGLDPPSKHRNSHKSGNYKRQNNGFSNILEVLFPELP